MSVQAFSFWTGRSLHRAILALTLYLHGLIRGTVIISRLSLTKILHGILSLIRECKRGFFLFVCLLGFSRATRVFFPLIWRRHLYRWREASFDVYSAPMVMEQWRFYSVSCLLWHGSTVDKGHLQGPETPPPVAKI